MSKQLLGLLQVVATVVRRRKAVDVELVARLMGREPRAVRDAMRILVARGFLDAEGRVTPRGESLIEQARAQGVPGSAFVAVGRVRAA